VPEVYESHRSRVGVEGYISLHTNRYPVPDMLIGRHLELHEMVDQVRIPDGHKLVLGSERFIDQPMRSSRPPCFSESVSIGAPARS
jgi:hypothetical protein